MQVIEAWAGWQASGLLTGPLHDTATAFMLSLTDALHEAGLVRPSCPCVWPWPEGMLPVDHVKQQRSLLETAVTNDMLLDRPLLPAANAAISRRADSTACKLGLTLLTL